MLSFGPNSLSVSGAGVFTDFDGYHSMTFISGPWPCKCHRCHVDLKLKVCEHDILQIVCRNFTKYTTWYSNRDKLIRLKSQRSKSQRQSVRLNKHFDRHFLTYYRMHWCILTKTVTITDIWTAQKSKCLQQLIAGKGFKITRQWIDNIQLNIGMHHYE